MRRVLLLVLAGVAITLLAWHPARVAIQTAVLLPALFPSAPLDPLALLTAPPRRESRTYAYAAGSVDAELFQPADAARHAAIILLLGAGDLPRSDLAIHFADALARSGIVSLVPESSGMLDERLTFDEVDVIRTSVALLRQLPSVDGARIGVVGLSASGGIAIVAAAQPDLRDQIRFVNSFGSYADASTLLVDVASRTIVVDGDVRAWQPEPRTIEVISRSLGPDLRAADRAAIDDGVSRVAADALLGHLAPAARERLQAISPSTYLAALTTHLYLMHDRDDSFIPFTESRDLVAHAPPGIVVRATEFSIFAHVIPDRAVPWHTFGPDLWRLFWHVQAVLLEVL